METIRENLQHMTTSKLKPYQRRLGWRTRGRGGREWVRQAGGRRRDRERTRERETGRNRRPHQTTHPISERWMRVAADCDSSPAALQIPLRLLHLFRSRSGFSHILISHRPSCSVCVTSLSSLKQIPRLLLPPLVSRCSSSTRNALLAF